MPGHTEFVKLPTVWRFASFFSMDLLLSFGEHLPVFMSNLFIYSFSYSTCL